MKHADKKTNYWLTRRSAFAFIGGGAAVASGVFVANGLENNSPEETMPNGKISTNTPHTAPGFEDKTREEWAKLTKADWRERLGNSAYYILREENTERPFTSELNKEKREGWFACAGCGQVLFSSEQKYNSGTGWPSFFNAIEGRLNTKPDRKLFYTRTEYHCSRCGGHHGHVFNDGPAPTGKRWCNNGDALVFVPHEDLEA